MAEYIAINEQTVAAGQNVLLNSRIPCNRGNIIHRDGSGNVILRGYVNNPCAGYARYKIDFQANIAIPTGGTATNPIALAISVDGEIDQASLGISTPGAVDQYNSVSGGTYIDVPRGMAMTVSITNAPASTDTTYVQGSINVQNANLVITRVA